MDSEEKQIAVSHGHSEVIRNLLLFVLTILSSIALNIFSGFSDKLGSIEGSISELNTNVAVIVTKQESQTDKNKLYETRLRLLEGHVANRWTSEDQKSFSLLLDKRFDTLIQAYEKRFNELSKSIMELRDKN